MNRIKCDICHSSTNSQAIPRIPILPPMIPVYYVPISQTGSDPAVQSPLQEKLGPHQSMQLQQPNPYSMYYFEFTIQEYTKREEFPSVEERPKHRN